MGRSTELFSAAIHINMTKNRPSSQETLTMGMILFFTGEYEVQIIDRKLGQHKIMHIAIRLNRD